ncbi:MAG: deoxyribonuclease IV [Erysipelotrichaceae bacterium]|nr:deoxyribonuclease IV [Erysipelotrichaceae bacterium]
MLIIGSHVGFNKDKQLLGSLEEALSYNANTFMFYTGAPQNTKRVEINDDLTKKAILKMKENNIDINNIIVHAPYIINLANNKEDDKYDFSIRFLIEEIKRCESLKIKYLVLHPGSHVGLGVDIGIKNIIFALNKVLENNNSVTILLETMAGKGTEIGSNFLELKKIIDGINKKELIGVCMDTCHMNDSGLDLSNFNNVLDLFDKEIGLSYLKCIHINDSKNIIGSRKDRHENIGYGTIGFSNLINIIYNERIINIPHILETPYVGEYAPYKEEIEMIRKKEFKNFKNV